MSWQGSSAEQVSAGFGDGPAGLKAMAGSSSSRSTTRSATEISRQVGLFILNVQNGGCKLWQWYEPGTTYLKQVLNDLVSTVREVKIENSEIRASLANSRAAIDGLVTERNVYEAKSRGQKEECGSVAEMACRIKMLEESRRFMLSVIVGFVVVIFALLLLR
uniref:Uncharacterized protein n=1 Tax=Oryza punctata TaxID=4537 RepID=A0A0E0KFN3_ORYPU